MRRPVLIGAGSRKKQLITWCGRRASVVILGSVFSTTPPIEGCALLQVALRASPSRVEGIASLDTALGGFPSARI